MTIGTGGGWSSSGGYYDKEGNWVRTKFCFAYCGPDRCNCCPPGFPKIRPQLQEDIFETNKEEDSNDNG